MVEESHMTDEEKRVRDSMDHTREHLAGKIDVLQKRVVNTIESTCNTVNESIQSAKEQVQVAVDAVKRTFDLPHQVRLHPMQAVLVAAATGALLGRRKPGDRRKRGAPIVEAAPPPPPFTPKGAGSAESRTPSPFRQFLSQELQKISAIAVAAAIGLARDEVAKKMPGVAKNIQDVMDGFTSRMGAKPVESPVLRPSNGNGRSDD